MEIFHLDTTSDIDFITAEYQDTGIKKINTEIDHLDYKYSKKYRNMDIIYHPQHHFFFRGFKCISLDILAEIKQNGTRDKDIKQAKTIQEFLENNTEIKRNTLGDVSLQIRYIKQRTLIRLLKIAIYTTKKLHIYKGVSYLWRRFVLKRNWK